MLNRDSKVVSCQAGDSFQAMGCQCPEMIPKDKPVLLQILNWVWLIGYIDDIEVTSTDILKIPCHKISF